MCQEANIGNPNENSITTSLVIVLWPEESVETAVTQPLQEVGPRRDHRSIRSLDLFDLCQFYPDYEYIIGLLYRHILLHWHNTPASKDV